MTHRYIDNFYAVEARNKVFDRLYQNAPKDKFYKPANVSRSDLTREERELEEHCTFRPQINGDSPFISERTMRNLAQQNRGRRRKPPPPPSRSRSKSPRKKKAPLLITPDNPLVQSGNFKSKVKGLVKGPPSSEGLPIFYFSVSAPPSFANGTYTALEEVSVTSMREDLDAPPETQAVEEYEDVEETDDEAGGDGPAPPPLPEWAFRPGGPTGAPKAAPKIVINKTNKPAAAAEEPTGWQAVLAEMQKKRGGGSGGLKKTEPEKPKPKPKKKKKKKGKDFKDVMDELNFKLARLRGEVDDDEEDDEEDDPPPPPAAGAESKEETSPSGKFPSKSSMMNLLEQKLKPPGGGEQEQKKVSRVQSMPAMNLSNMLSKRMSAANSGAPGGPSQKSIDEGPGKIAVPHPAKIPAAPPLPAASKWPPTAFAGEYSAADLKEDEEETPQSKQSSGTVETANVNTSYNGTGVKKKKIVRKLVKKEVPVQRPKKSVTKQTFQSTERALPVGYYMPQPMEGMVSPQSIVPGGYTTLALENSVSRAYQALKDLGKQGVRNQEQDESTPVDAPIELNTSVVGRNLSFSAADSEIGNEMNLRELDAQSDEFIATTELDDDDFDKVRRKKTISELPLPNGFNSQVERMQKSNSKREAAREAELNKELRQYLNPAYKPSPSSIANSSAIGGGDAGVLIKSKPKKREPTIPRAPVSHVEEHLSQKAHSHRKSSTSLRNEKVNDLPLSERHHHVLNEPIYATVEDPHTTFWVSNLRGRSSSPVKSHTRSRRMSTAEVGVSPIRKRTEFTRSGHDLSFTNDFNTTHSSFGADTTGGQPSPYNNAYNYFQHFRPLTVAKAPSFRAHEIVNRRAQEMKEKEDYQQQLEYEEEQRRKALKQKLREQALRTAQENNAYRTNANSRYHRHQKMIEKYGNRSDVGINLAQVTKNAYQEYKAKHHLPLNCNDTLYTPALVYEQESKSLRQSAQDQLDEIHNEEKLRATLLQRQQQLLSDLQQDWNDYGDDVEDTVISFTPAISGKQQNAHRNPLRGSFYDPNSYFDDDRSDYTAGSNRLLQFDQYASAGGY